MYMMMVDQKKYTTKLVECWTKRA